MKTESKSVPSIHWFQMGAFPLERVQIHIQAAEQLKIPYEIIPNDDPRVSKSDSFMKAREGERIIKVDYGDRFQKYWNLVNELSPVQEAEVLPEFQPEEALVEF